MAKNKMKRFAALDLGSNSFHMIIAEVDGHHIKVIDKIRESIKLAAGINELKILERETEARALECLTRFGQRLSNLVPRNVRVVGTNALRSMRKSHEFLEKAQLALGCPVEIIAGREEARLIYLGVANAISCGGDKRLVIDIGGGSTEVIVGHGPDPVTRESLYMGCVTLANEYFPDGIVRKKSMSACINHAESVVQPFAHGFKQSGWDVGLGASGTCLAIAEVIEQCGWSQDGVTKAALEKLVTDLVDIGDVNKIAYPTLREDRRPIFPSGVAILYGLFKGLGIKKLQPTDGALREGVIYDMIGRRTECDTRLLTVNRMMQRYHVDVDHAQRVEKTALKLFDQVADNWGLQVEEDRLFLSWAAKLHEIGLEISHDRFHRHGAYIVHHCDMPGFSWQAQRVLAALVQLHRKKMALEQLDLLPKRWRDDIWKLGICLRLAVILERAHIDHAPYEVRLDVDKHRVKLELPPNWSVENPLTEADLSKEMRYQKKAGVFNFTIGTKPN